MNLNQIIKPAGMLPMLGVVFVSSVAFARQAETPAEPAPAPAPAPAATPAVEKVAHVRMQTSFGDIVLELDGEKAPVSVANFLKYVDKGFYDNTLFHRTIPNFMIQGGGYGGGLIEKKDTDAPIKNEWQNGLKNFRGAIAMARTMQPDSATAQFFINTVDNPRLDEGGPSLGGAGYAVFGKVIAGMGVVDAIKDVPTRNEQSIGFQPTPAEPVVIEKVSRVASDQLSAATKAAEESVAKGQAELKRRLDAIKAAAEATRKRVEEQAKALGTPEEQFTKAMDLLKAKGVDVAPGSKTASGLWVTDITVGTGAQPVETDTIKVHYTGWLVNGNKVDSSLDRGQPTQMRLNQFIKGWVEGISAMKAGGKRYLVIPYELGYGEQGRPPVIPSKSTLVFEVELLEVVGK